MKMNLRSWMNLFARKPPPAEPVPSEPEAPEPPIIRHELFRNDEARLYVDVNPGVGFAVVVAARWPGKVQPWLSYDEMRRIVRQMDDIVKQQKLHELNEMFWDAYQRGMDKP